MKFASITTVAACLLAMGCNSTPATTAPVLTGEVKQDYYRLMAKARAGDTSATFTIAKAYADPDQFPDTKGMKADVYEAAIWCTVLHIQVPGKYDDECKAMTASLSPKLKKSAIDAGQNRYQYSYATGRAN